MIPNVPLLAHHNPKITLNALPSMVSVRESTVDDSFQHGVLDPLISSSISSPYLVAFVVVLLTAFYSDKRKNRSLFICFHALLASLGYAMIAVAGLLKAGPLWRYWGVYPAASGFFSAVTLLITWTINNQVRALLY